MTAEPRPQPVPATVAPTGNGRVFVRFPEELARAARPQAPSWLPVVFWTLLLGVPGVVSAVRRGAQARRGGNERHPYWIAFGTVLTVGVVAGLALTSLRG